MKVARLAAVVGLSIASSQGANATRITDLPTSDGPRVWIGGGVALDPAYAATTLGGDWFVRPWLAGGLALAATVPGAGDSRAVESGFGFASLLCRFRPVPSGGLLRAEVFAGGGLALVRFGSPGRHDELAPDAALGGALGLPILPGVEIAAEAVAHVTFGKRAAARNFGHTSEVVTIVVRFGN